MFKKAKALVLQMLGIATLPVNAENKVEFSEEQQTALASALGDDADNFIEKFVEAANQELENAEELKANKQELEEAKTQLKALLGDSGIDFNAEDKKTDPASATETTAEIVSALKGKIDSLEEAVQKLGDSPEKDLEEITAQKTMKHTHSKTHLFASGKAYDSFDGRPWNKRAAGLKVGATEFTEVDIQKINEDFGAFWREERDEVLTVLRDYRRLPAHWGVISNIDDEIAYASMLTGEVTQARKKSWLPKNKNKFIPQKGEVFPAQIDLEWEGFELQKMESSWMNRFNKNGSQPYKMSFVQFLLVEILKKAREEDQIVLINGVHVPTADDETVPQSFMYRGKGLLKLFQENINKTYKAFDDLGVPTSTNIVDYVKDFCERLPAEVRNAPGFHFYMSPTWRRKYDDRRKVEDGLMPTYQPGKSTVENFPNIMLTELDYLDGTDFMFITTSDNISILQNIKSEESFLNVDKLKRYIYIYGDYKIGILVHAFGMQWEDGVPKDYRNQLVWSNNVPVLNSVYAPIPADDTTPSAANHNYLQTGVNTQATAITDIDDVEVGQYVTILGNTGTASTIANSGAFDLDGAITLSENVEITLYKKAASGNGRFVEIERKTVNAENETFNVLAPDATTADAADGTLFLTSANTGATAITNIANAVAGEVYTIRGGSDTNATTIAASGNFSRISAAITLEEDNEIVVQFNGSKFVELSRVVA